MRAHVYKLKKKSKRILKQETEDNKWRERKGKEEQAGKTYARHVEWEEERKGRLRKR